MEKLIEVLNQILEIAGLGEKKQEFMGQFLESVGAETAIDLVDGLPTERQERVKAELFKEGIKPEEAAEALQHNFGQEEVMAKFEEKLKAAVVDYVKTIGPELSEEQKNKMVEILAGVQ